MSNQTLSRDRVAPWCNKHNEEKYWHLKKARPEWRCRSCVREYQREYWHRRDPVYKYLHSVDQATKDKRKRLEGRMDGA